MADLVRLIEEALGERFIASLEEQALRLLEREASGEDPLVEGLDREIALALEQLDRLRALRLEQERSLCQMECYVDTELMGMEARTPRYSPYRFPEREKLQRRLLELEAERRRLAWTHEEKLREMHSRLLSLLEKHKLLDEEA